MEIDLNADLGEGAGTDAEMMPLISSANICCGAHAGDERTIRTTARMAAKRGVVIGAHPGFVDRANFGRVEMTEPPPDFVDSLIRQVDQKRVIAI